MTNTPTPTTIIMDGEEPNTPDDYRLVAAQLRYLSTDTSMNWPLNERIQATAKALCEEANRLEGEA